MSLKEKRQRSPSVHYSEMSGLNGKHWLVKNNKEKTNANDNARIS